MVISGLIIGILFGFLLKRSRFCFTGTIRDIYLEKKSYNLVIIFAVIFTQAFLYHLMVLLGLVPEAELLSFSLPAIIIGSFIYGFGAVMMNGCMTASLVKSGDGRIIGFVSILSFIVGTYFATNSFLKPVTQYLDLGQSVFEKFYYGLPKLVPVVVSLIICVIVYGIMYRHHKNNKMNFKLPQQYTGIRYILFEKIWSKEVAAILIGVLMAAGFYFHNQTGINAGFAISTPILTWANECGANIDLSGG